MTDRPCPDCGLPVSDAAFAAGTCPCCGHTFAAPPRPVKPVAPAPARAAPPVPRSEPLFEKDRGRVGVLFWVAAGAVVTAAGVLGYVISARVNS